MRGAVREPPLQINREQDRSSVAGPYSLRIIRQHLVETPQRGVSTAYA